MVLLQKQDYWLFQFLFILILVYGLSSNFYLYCCFVLNCSIIHDRASITFCWLDGRRDVKKAIFIMLYCTYAECFLKAQHLNVSLALELCLLNCLAGPQVLRLQDVGLGWNGVYLAGYSMSGLTFSAHTSPEAQSWHFQQPSGVMAWLSQTSCTHV